MDKRTKSNPFVGRYCFHLHTAFTDGKTSVQEYFQCASDLRIDQLIFLEHIRKVPSYDVKEFIGQIRACVHTFGIPARVGFEVKLLPDASLDISDEHIALAEVVGVAEHSFPNDFGLLRRSFFEAINTYTRIWPQQTFVWVHPGLWFEKKKLLRLKEAEYCEMITYAVENGFFIERNVRYRLVSDQAVALVPLARLVVGIDAHDMEDIMVQRERFS